MGPNSPGSYSFQLSFWGPPQAHTPPSPPPFRLPYHSVRTYLVTGLQAPALHAQNQALWLLDRPALAIGS